MQSSLSRSRKRRVARPGGPQKAPVRMKPDADPLLRSVFSRIGRPPEAPFVPDPFQLEALEAVRQSDCLVTAPTGSGKTWIAEQAIEDVFRRGGRAWYASPLKALTNAKWVEFGQQFGADHVGILTGDTKENPDAPIIVGTTEILRNQLYDAMHQGKDLPCDLVILDEAHYLGDPDRGVVWEEIMIYLPARVNLLLLSATIGNAEEIASWLSSLRDKPCRVVRETGRPVPLFPLFLHPTGRIMPFLEQRRLYGKVAEFSVAGSSPAGRGRPPHFGDILRVLREYHLLPAIFFLKSRSECDGALKTCRSGPGVHAGEAFREDVGELFSRFPYLEQHRQFHDLQRWRVAAHHGGQLPAWKFFVERMMKQGHLEAIFATSTVAAGVNFPARTIVLFNSDIFDGHSFNPLTGTAFHQMTGRAGRRGQDKIGFLALVPGRFLDVSHVRRLLFREAEPIESRIRNDFSMVLNLLLSQTPEDVRVIFERSFAAFQAAARGKKPGRGLWEGFIRHLEFLKKEGFVGEDDRLTENGLWASKLRLDHPLLIAEGLRREAFPAKDERLFAAAIAPFVYDGDLDVKFESKKIPRAFREAVGKVASVLKPLLDRMKAAGFPVQPLRLWPALVVYDWARGVPWDDIIRRTGINDGDLAMLVLRTADNLRQIASLRESHPETAELAAKGREAILREPVVFEWE